MKKIVFVTHILFCFTIANAQDQTTPAARLAHHIADKMADSLELNNQQRAKLFTINMELYRQKSEARRKSNDRAVVGKDLQRIEGTRDSYYKTVLSEDKYVIYLKKKRNLVTAK